MSLATSIAPKKASYELLFDEIGWAGINAARERKRKIFP